MSVAANIARLSGDRIKESLSDNTKRAETARELVDTLTELVCELDRMVSELSAENKRLRDSEQTLAAEEA